MIVCVSPGGQPLSLGDVPASRLLLATIEGVYLFERDAPDAPWAAAGHALAGRHVGSLVYLPAAGLVFAGAHSGGLFASADGGGTWEPADAGIAAEHLHVFTLAAHARPGGTVLFAGTQPPALYRSLDLGRTWNEVKGIADVPGTSEWTFPGPPHLPHVKHVAAHPAEPETLYVCIEQGALLKSVDDGATWEEITTYVSPDDRWYHDAHRVVFRSNPADLYFASGEGLYHSLDAGRTWSHLTTRFDRVAYPDATFLDPDDERVVYIAGSATSPDAWRNAPDAADPAVLRSRDGGGSWEELDRGLPRPLRGNIEALSMHHWARNAAFYAGTATGELFAGENRGERWELIAADLPPVSKLGHYKAVYR